MNGRLCFVVAADVEYRAAAEVLSGFTNHDIVLHQCGIGAIRFEEAFRSLLQAEPIRAVIITGLCGALTRNLRRGDLVLYERCVTPTDSIEFDPELTDHLHRKLSPLKGTGLTLPRVVTRGTEKHRLGAIHDAIAVDMETYAIARVCGETGVPVAALRIVSDGADEDIPDFNRSLGQNGEILGRKIPGVLLERPHVSLRFLSSMRPTMRGFKKALAVIIGAMDSAPFRSPAD